MLMSLFNQNRPKLSKASECAAALNACRQGNVLPVHLQQTF